MQSAGIYFVGVWASRWVARAIKLVNNLPRHKTQKAAIQNILSIVSVIVSIVVTVAIYRSLYPFCLTEHDYVSPLLTNRSKDSIIFLRCHRHYDICSCFAQHRTAAVMELCSVE